MAYIGSNTLNNSSMAENSDNYQIPTYSAFNDRSGIGNLLKDFYHEVSSLKGSKRPTEQKLNTVRSEEKRLKTDLNPLSEKKSNKSEQDPLDEI